MPYNPAIPAPNDKLSQSQADILGNFAEIDTFVNVNHGPFGAADEGKHRVVSMPQQAADAATAAQEVALYAKNDANTGNTELFFRRPSSGAVVSTTGASLAARGWSYLPSGLLMKWGTTGNLVGGAATFAYPGGQPAFTACFSVQLTIFSNGAGADPNTAVYVTSMNVASFNVWVSKRKDSTATTVVVNYLSLGF